MGLGPLRLSRKLFAYSLLLGAFFGLALLRPSSVEAAAGISQQVNFQGRLLNAQGAVVADGYYNIEFKIYQDGDGQTTGNTTGSPAGTLKWTEDYLNVNSKGVLVKNGFLSVQLGSVNPFGSSVDWNQDTLWLSMNVASTNVSCTPFSTCTPDGEMVPMKRLSATPYSLNAGLLGGIASSGFLQNTTTPQTANFNITGNGVVGGTMSVAGLLSANAGFTASGAAVNLNKNSNFTVDIGTGTSTGAISIGGGLNTFSLNSTALDVSTIGVITGATGITSTGTITGDFFSGNGASLTSLNASNLASGTVNSARVTGTYSGLTGTGALATGSIASGFGAISTGNTITTTSTITGSSLASTVVTGTAPITVNSTTKVTNLNADLLDGLDSTAFAAASGSANYIQNGTTPQTADFNITGNGVVGGTMSVAGLLSSTAGLTVTGAAVNLNKNSNFTVDIGTGTSTGALSLGGGLNTFSLNSTALDISTTGVITGATGITSTGTIQGGVVNATSGFQVAGVAIASSNLSDGANLAKLNGTQTFTGANTFSNAANAYTGVGTNLTALNATNLTSGTVDTARVSGNYTGITGTGALATGSIASGFGTISTGSTIATTSSVTGNTLASTVATGTAPITVNSTTKVTNLNADLLDGLDSTAFAAASGSANYIQNGTSLQTANFAVASAATGSIAALIQGASGQTADIFQVKANGTATPLLSVSNTGAIQLQPTSDSGLIFNIKSSTGNNMFSVDSANGRVGIGLSANNLPTLTNAGLEVKGALRLSGTGSSFIDSFITPLGTTLTTRINIPLYDPGAFNQILALGLPSTASANARVVLIADARAGAHQASIGVLSPDENQIFGFSYDGSNTTGLVKNTAASIALQGNALNILTATNSGGAARVGIGNGNTTYALDVTGDINTSTVYRIGTVSTLTAGSLTFSTAAAGTIQSATSQALNLTGNAASTFNTTAGSLTLNGFAGSIIQTNGVTRATFDTSNGLYLGNGITAATPSAFTVSGTGSSTTGVAGGTLTLQGGNATVGNANGGNINISGGTGFGTGVNGLVVLSTPSYSTASSDANCYTSGARVAASCTLTSASVNGTGAIIAGFTTAGQTVTLPDPAITTAGRVVYITASNLSQDFTLRANVGAGVGIEQNIAMRQNTTATMIWNGSDWTAAGASSSTTLQAAYDNTLTSAGGAELLLSNGANANGLTIRDSSASPVNGTLLEIQNSAAATLFAVNGKVTEYTTNSGAESTFSGTDWIAAASATVTRYTASSTNIGTGQASTSVATTTTNQGVYNRLNTTLTAGNNYNVSFTTRQAAGSPSFNDMSVVYSKDGTTVATTACKTGQSVAESVFTKVNCSFTAPASGITSSNAILITQVAAATRTFYVDNISVTIAADYNYASDGSVNSALSGTTWSTVGATVTRDTTVGNDASDSAKVVTTGANQGIRNQLTIKPLTSTLYRLTVYGAATTAGFNSFTVRYSPDNGSTFQSCVDYNTQTLPSTTASFQKITCYVTTPATTVTTPYVYFTQTDATGRTFHLDTFSMTLSSDSTPNVQIGGGVLGGPTTLFTVDKGASAPIASNNDALLGSMYYDTSLGKLQCYESDGWGACGSSPDNIVTISPEYTNAVLNGTGVGTMTSDFCSDLLNLNDGSAGQASVCGTNETFNFYKWTSPQPTAQTYSIYVTYQLPGTFKGFTSGSTYLKGRTDSTNATVQYQVYRNTPGSPLATCGSTVAVSTGVQSSMQQAIAAGTADPSTCGFGANDSIVFKISTTASSNANAYVGDLGFTYNNK